MLVEDMVRGSTLPLFLASAAFAQFGPLLSSRQAPQAKSPEELDFYLEIYTATSPRVIVEKVQQFAENFPQSEFLGFAWQDQMKAFQELNDFGGVLRAGENALALLPRNINTVMTLATVIPNGVDGRKDGPRLLDQAVGYANLALRELRTFQVPREIPLAEWEKRCAGMESDLHEALGHIATKRGDLATAEREFQLAITRNPQPNGRQYLRLSSVLLLAGRRPEAAEAAEQAARLGSGEIRRLALAQLESIRGQGRQ